MLNAAPSSKSNADVDADAEAAADADFDASSGSSRGSYCLSTGLIINLPINCRCVYVIFHNFSLMIETLFMH